jgi:N-acetyl-gamma-glutamylphosphate reductase
MLKTAILLGASGATGGQVLQLLLADDRYNKVKLFSRSPIDSNSPKVEQHIISMFDLINTVTALLPMMCFAA